jgi:hypothetical protein
MTFIIWGVSTVMTVKARHGAERKDPHHLE